MGKAYTKIDPALYLCFHCGSTNIVIDLISEREICWDKSKLTWDGGPPDGWHESDLLIFLCEDCPSYSSGITSKHYVHRKSTDQNLMLGKKLKKGEAIKIESLFSYLN